MRITKTFDADVKSITLKKAKDSEEKVVVPVLGLTLTYKQLADFVGPELANMVSQAATDNDGKVPFAQIKPDVVYESHQVKFGDRKQVTTFPLAKKITPLGAGVRLEIAVPFTFSKQHFDALVANFPGAIDVSLEPSQGELPIGDDKVALR